MSSGELATDPFVSRCVSAHRTIVTQRKAARKRNRLSAMALIGAFLGLVATVLGSEFIGASGPPQVAMARGGGGDLMVSVPGGGGGGGGLVVELRSELENEGLDIRVESVTGRPEVEGRLLADGEGVELMDPQASLDHTGTVVRITPEDLDDSSTVQVVVEGAQWAVGSYTNVCPLLGTPAGPVVAGMEASGFEVSVFDPLVGPVDVDRDPGMGSLVVINGYRSGENTFEIYVGSPDQVVDIPDCP